jgi:hypothetical protein
MTVFQKERFLKILVHAIVSQILCDSQLVYFFVNLWSDGVLGYIEVIIHLETEPERCRVPEIGGQTQGCICCDASFAVNDLVYPARRNFEITPEFVLANVHWLEEFLIKNFTWMYCRYLFHFVTSNDNQQFLHRMHYRSSI